MTSKLSVTVGELKEEKARSITTYVHHKLLREQREKLEKNPMNSEERDKLLEQIEEHKTEAQRLRNSMTFGGVIDDPLRGTQEYKE